VRSRFRPGLTTGYATGDGVIRSPGEIPEEVVQQLIPLERPEVMLKTFLTIGLAFSPAFQFRGEPRAFQTDLRECVKRGLLNSKSPFLAELQGAVTAFITTGTWPELPFENAPTTPLEDEIVRALQLDLRP